MFDYQEQDEALTALIEVQGSKLLSIRNARIAKASGYSDRDILIRTGLTPGSY